MGIAAVILRPDICSVLNFLESCWSTYRKITDHWGHFGSREAQNIYHYPWPETSPASSSLVWNLKMLCTFTCMEFAESNRSSVLWTAKTKLSASPVHLDAVQIQTRKTLQPHFCQMRENSINAQDRRAEKFWAGGWTGSCKSVFVKLAIKHIPMYQSITAKYIKHLSASPQKQNFKNLCISSAKWYLQP